MSTHPWLVMKIPPSVPKNRTFKEIGNDMSVTLRYALHRDHYEVGRVESLDRAFNLGRACFQEWVQKKWISKKEFLELQWILLIHGYSLEEWAKNSIRRKVLDAVIHTGEGGVSKDLYEFCKSAKVEKLSDLYGMGKSGFEAKIQKKVRVKNKQVVYGSRIKTEIREFIDDNGENSKLWEKR